MWLLSQLHVTAAALAAQVTQVSEPAGRKRSHVLGSEERNLSLALARSRDQSEPTTGKCGGLLGLAQGHVTTLDVAGWATGQGRACS